MRAGVGLGMRRDVVIETDRLLLRLWRDGDLPEFAAINADPEVAEHFPAVLTRGESDDLAWKIRTRLSDQDFGFWAVEIPSVTPFAGFVGISRVPFEAHFTPAVEIGWRLARTHWGCGYATEAARAALRYGFDNLAVDEIVAFTVPQNERSRRVMLRLGMSNDPVDDFHHPRFAPGHRLAVHTLYRLSRAAWQRSG